MLENLSDAIKDRIKTPIIGTYILLFIWFNYLIFNKLVLSFHDPLETEAIYKSIVFDFFKPLSFTILYVIVTALIKIINNNWDAFINLISNNLTDKMKGLHFTENLKTIGFLEDQNIRMFNVIVRARTKNSQMRSGLDQLSSNLATTKNESQVATKERNKTKL